MNALSHRTQHRNASKYLVATTKDRRPSGDEFRAARHNTAQNRRREQRQRRVLAGTDRATLRARRTEVMK